MCVYPVKCYLTRTPERRWHGYERERGWIPQTSQQQSDSGWYKEGRQQNTQSQTGLQEIPPRSDDQTYSTDKALLILLFFFFCFPSQLCSSSSKTFEPSREVSLTQIVAGAPWCLLPSTFLLMSTFKKIVHSIAKTIYHWNDEGVKSLSQKTWIIPVSRKNITKSNIIKYIQYTAADTPLSPPQLSTCPNCPHIRCAANSHNNM